MWAAVHLEVVGSPVAAPLAASQFMEGELPRKFLMTPEVQHDALVSAQEG